MHYCISDFILDITQNAVEANATAVDLEIITRDKKMTIVVSDDGKGMSPAQVQKLSDPYAGTNEKHPGRRSLGIPFLKHTLESLSGSLTINSKEGFGTVVTAVFPLEHIDCPPLGDLIATFESILLLHDAAELQVTRQTEKGEYTWIKSDLLANGLSHARQLIATYEETLR